MRIEWIIPLLTGWLAGWIVNYLSDVLPFTRKLSAPVCSVCDAPYSLKNYLLFQPCANGHARPVRGWLVQLIITAISLYLYAQPPTRIGGYWPGMLLLVYFGLVFVIDMEHRLILHPTSIAGSLIALTLGTVSNGLTKTLLGGLYGLIIMLAFYFFGVLFTQLRAKRMQAQGLEADDEEALGQGDVILVTVLGFLVGSSLVWFMVLVSVLLGGLVSILLVAGMLLTRRYNSNSLMVFISYGPYCIVSASLIVFFPHVLQMFLPK